MFYHQAARCAKHDWNMFILSMIETTLQGSFNLSQTKHVSANVISLFNIVSPAIPKELDKWD